MGVTMPTRGRRRHPQELLGKRSLQDVEHGGFCRIAEDGIEIVEENVVGRLISSHAQSLHKIDVSQGMPYTRVVDHVLFGGLARPALFKIPELRLGGAAHAVIRAA
jgi:hypothetical protein